MDRKILVSLRICSGIIFCIGLIFLVTSIYSFFKISILLYKGYVFARYYYFIMGLLLLISSIELGLLKSWGRKLTIISSVVMIIFLLRLLWVFRSMISAHKQIYQTHFSNPLPYYYVLLIAIASFSLLIYFLCRPKVKEQFK